MSGARAPIQVAFAQYFAPWGLFLPDAVVAARADGWLLGEGWSVRWRWNGDGSLQFVASHRMTNLRWEVIAPDGAMTSRDVPYEAMITRPGATNEEKAAVRADYHTAWQAHGEALAAERMEPIQSRPPVPHELTGPAVQTWWAEGSGWASAPRLRSG